MFGFEFSGLITKTCKFDDRTYEIRLGWGRNGKRLARNFFHNFYFTRWDGATEGVVGSLQARECMGGGEGRSETTYLYLIRMLIEKCVCMCFLCLRRRLLLGARRR